MSDQTEIVINACYGGFGLSDLAMQEYTARTNRAIDDDWWSTPRDDPDLVKIVKELGERANGQFSKLKIARIPGQYTRFYSIDEYDGQEWVTVHYDKYKIHHSKCILLDRRLTQTERISRAVAVLAATLNE